MENVLSVLMLYVDPILDGLLWDYIAGFILFTYVYGELESQLSWPWLQNMKIRFKVAVIGLGYAVAYYFSYHLQTHDIPKLAISYLFTFGFHKLLVDSLIGYLQSKFGGFKEKIEAVLDIPFVKQSPPTVKVTLPDQGKGSNKEKAKQIAIGVLDTIKKVGSNPKTRKAIGGLLKKIFKK